MGGVSPMVTTTPASWYCFAASPTLTASLHKLRVLKANQGGSAALSGY